MSSAPPEPRTRNENYPSLLYSWWCTLFAVVIILFRLGGRKVRTNVLFREDWIMAFSLVPLLIRMGLVHVVLLYGTNNVIFTGLTSTRIQHRETGSQLVLASRIFYAMFIWVSKWTVSEFLKRNFSNIWKRSHERTLLAIRVFLILTFIAVVIADLAECHPFSHYWQVVPDPGPQCRQGYAHLLTMGCADIFTDLLLVAFPIPVILSSQMNWKRKGDLVVLFSLSIILIIITGFRMPEVIKHLGRQQYRTVWASSEILASAAVANAVVLGSFIRDRGVKKNKYRRGSHQSDSIARAPTRRPTIVTLPDDSDEDLFRAIGCRIPTDLLEEEELEDSPVDDLGAVSQLKHRRDVEWNSPPAYKKEDHDERDSGLGMGSDAISAAPPRALVRNEMSFLDAGGLLPPESGTGGAGSTSEQSSSAAAVSHESGEHSGHERRSDGAGSPSEQSSSIVAHDFANTPVRSHGSRTLVSDLGGIISSTAARPEARRPSQAHSAASRRTSHGSRPELVTSRQRSVRPEPGSMELKDVGGLLR